MNRTCRSAPILLTLLMTSLPALTQNEYRVINVADAGTIVGTVKWSGPVPTLPTVAINKDPQICDPAGVKKRDMERLIIGPAKGVANTVVYLRDVPAGKPMDLPQPRRFLNQRTCRYEPHILLVPLNAEMSLKSSDPTLHTVHMQGAADYNLPFPFPEQVISRPMNRPGMVEMRCNAGHVWMNATIFVVVHPYYAVTDELGNFTIDGVPPGTYEIVAWHEGWQMRRQVGFYDVLTQERLTRPVFSEPRTWEKSVTVGHNGTVRVDFVLSDNKLVAARR